MPHSVRVRACRGCIPVAVVLLAVSTQHARAQQADISIDPFLAYLPGFSTSPLAGLALTIANGPLALRGSGNVSFETRSSFDAPNSTRRWGADADALLMLRGYGSAQRSLAPFVFAGVGMSRDEEGLDPQQQDWSYGAGIFVPVGSALEIFGETRYRMSSYMLPTSPGAPSPRQEVRFGLSFHLGGRSAPRRSDDSRITVIPAGAPVLSVPATSSASAARVLSTADRYLGVKYKWGGTSPTTGFDCSGFTQYVFAKHGVQLPRTSRQQATVGTRLPADWDAVSPGDLVMFEEDGRIGHVAIYAGRNRIIHATSSGGAVRYDDLTTQRGRWFAEHMVAARRVTPDARGLLLDLAKGFAQFGIELDPPDKAPRPR